MVKTLLNSLGIANQCEKILTEMNVDFVGLALQNQEGPDVSWHFAAGNSNEKYKRITVRYGKGIAGKVISTGSSITIKNFPEGISGKVLEYPIMLAEKLVYAFAVPLFINSVPKGVLLVGRRSNIPLTEKEQLTVKQAAIAFESLF